MIENGYVTIEDVLQYNYVIPTYQRGYRWDKDNVIKLLEDIYENRLIDGDEKAECYLVIGEKAKEIFRHDEKFAITEAIHPYCIQPLVVCNMQDKFDVIDGQQRLTTITIILCALKSVCNENKINIQWVSDGIKISYESRKESQKFLNDLWEGIIDESQQDSNIDFMYIMQAYCIAVDFFQKELKKAVGNESNYATLLKNILLKNTRFIWYCIDQNSMDPHEVFANFNSGKIELTNAELIKALFMDVSNYDEVNKITDIEDKRIVISEKWDEIETSLHNPDFWSFVPHRNQYGDGGYDTRIDVIFEMFIMMNHINNRKISIDSYIEYRKNNNRERYIFDEMDIWMKQQIKEGTESGKTKNEIMQICWSDVRKIYLGLQELYQIDVVGENDNKIYNMAGLYINLANRISGKVDSYTDDTFLFLRIYYHLSEVMKAPRFGENNRNSKLQKLIKQEIGLKDSIENEIKSVRHTNSDEKNVDKNADKIVKILLAYNIGLLNNSKGIGQRFDFRLFANITWQREHIFASNVDEVKNKKQGLDTKEERKAALEILAEEIQETDNGMFKNKYVEYVKTVYFHNKMFPPEVSINCNTTVLNFDNPEHIKVFIENNLSNTNITPFSMLAKALDSQIKSMKMKEYYDVLELIENAETYDDENIKRQILYRILKDLGRKFYTREYVDVRGIVEKALKNYPQDEKYIINISGYENIITDKTKEKAEHLESVMNAYRDYVRLLYMTLNNETGRADDYIVKDYSDLCDEDWKELFHVFKICKRTINTNIDTFFSEEFAKLLVDNTMGNMTLLTGGNKADLSTQITNQNQIVTNKSFKLKKKDIHEFFQKGDFVPLGTVLVFSDAYNDSPNTSYFWLPDSRLRYINDIINTLQTFLD